VAHHVKTGVLRLIGSDRPDRRWYAQPAVDSVVDVSTRVQDGEFARRLGPMLVNLRTEAGWSREMAEEKLGIPASTLGKWERGQHPPKSADLSLLYLGYVKAGVPADPTWFLDPPVVVRLDPVRALLDERRRAAEEAAAYAAAEPPRRAAGGRAAPRDRSPGRRTPGSPR